MSHCKTCTCKEVDLQELDNAMKDRAIGILDVAIATVGLPDGCVSRTPLKHCWQRRVVTMDLKFDDRDVSVAWDWWELFLRDVDWKSDLTVAPTLADEEIRELVKSSLEEAANRKVR